MKTSVIILLVLFLFVSCTKDEEIESNSCGGNQYTCIPDSSFEQALIDLAIDSEALNNKESPNSRTLNFCFIY